MPSAERLREACTCQVYKKKISIRIRFVGQTLTGHRIFSKKSVKKSVKNTLKEALLLNGCIFGAEIRFARAWRLSGDAENLNCQYARNVEKQKRSALSRAVSLRREVRRDAQSVPRRGRQPPVGRIAVRARKSARDTSRTRCRPARARAGGHRPIREATRRSPTPCPRASSCFARRPR